MDAAAAHLLDADEQAFVHLDDDPKCRVEADRQEPVGADGQTAATRRKTMGLAPAR